MSEDEEDKKDKPPPHQKAPQTDFSSISQFFSSKRNSTTECRKRSRAATNKKISDLSSIVLDLKINKKKENVFVPIKDTSTSSTNKNHAHSRETEATSPLHHDEIKNKKSPASEPTGASFLKELSMGSPSSSKKITTDVLNKRSQISSSFSRVRPISTSSATRCSNLNEPTRSTRPLGGEPYLPMPSSMITDKPSPLRRILPKAISNDRPEERSNDSRISSSIISSTNENQKKRKQKLFSSNVLLDQLADPCPCDMEQNSTANKDHLYDFVPSLPESSPQENLNLPHIPRLTLQRSDISCMKYNEHSIHETSDVVINSTHTCCSIDEVLSNHIDKKESDDSLLTVTEGRMTTPPSIPQNHELSPPPMKKTKY